MAKKNFKDLYRPNTEIKTDGTETAKARLSPQAKGEHKDGYKDVVIRLRITAEEKDRWQQKAKEQNNKPLSAFIRDSVEQQIKANEG